MLLRHLKPTDPEIRRLALRETEATQVERFEPIARGPIFAVIGVALVLLAALPSCLLRLLRGALRGESGET